MICWLSAAMLLISGAAADWPVLGEAGRKTGDHVDPDTVFEPVDVYWADNHAVAAARDLGAVARAALRRIERQDRALRPVPHGMLDDLGISPEAVRRTLRFVAEVAEEDRGADVQRLDDPEWLAAHFRVYRWNADIEDAARHRIPLDDGQIRLTRYLVYRFPGSLEPTAEFTTALYAVPRDELGLSAVALASNASLMRRLFTRKQVLDGVYEDGGARDGDAEPLVYLRREHVHEAMLQGTVQVELQDGSRRTFSVHRSNGRSYRRGSEHEDQDRCWYFRESRSSADGGVDNGVALRPGVAVAGDINNLGYGGLYALEGPDGSLRLVVLADTGGAFQPNLYQLDLFTGTHTSREALDAATRDVPRRPAAYLMVLRDAVEPQ